MLRPSQSMDSRTTASLCNRSDSFAYQSLTLVQHSRNYIARLTTPTGSCLTPLSFSLSLLPQSVSVCMCVMFQCLQQ